MATPSLLIIPDRYKAAKLYSQLPESGDGDFDVTRSTTATRVNASGLIESVASGVPRIDYTGGGCGKLLVEPAATNLLLRSEEFDNASWTKVAGSVTANAAISPDGTMSADLLLDDAADGNLRQVVTTTASNHTQSIYCKPFGRSGFLVWNSVGYVDFDFNLVAVIDSSSATGTITAVGNGWFRLTCTFTASAGTPNINFTNRGTGRVNGVSGVYIYGAQLELGSVATSYIPTVAAAVTRNADVISLSSASGLIGQSQGVIYAEVDLKNWETSSRVFAISDNTNSNRVTLLIGSSQRIRCLATVAGVSQFDLNSASSANGVHKVAVAYANNDFAFYVNGVQIGTSTSALVPACNNVYIGKSETSSSGLNLNDRISAAAIYTTRLDNATLASLTTL